MIERTISDQEFRRVKCFADGLINPEEMNCPLAELAMVVSLQGRKGIICQHISRSDSQPYEFCEDAKSYQKQMIAVRPQTHIEIPFERPSRIIYWEL